MTEVFKPDFLFSTITNVHFSSAWASFAVDGLGQEPMSVDLEFPEISGGTPGFTCMTAGVPNPSFHIYQPPTYTVTKADLSAKLRTDAGTTFTAFGLVRPGAPHLSLVTMFIKLDHAVNAQFVARVRASANSPFSLGYGVIAATYKTLKAGQVFNDGDEFLSPVEQHRGFFNPSPVGGTLDITIDTKKLTIS